MNAARPVRRLSQEPTGQEKVARIRVLIPQWCQVVRFRTATEAGIDGVCSRGPKAPGLCR